MTNEKHKFVKIECHESYFMQIDSVDDLPDGIEEQADQRMEGTVGDEIGQPKDYHPSMFMSRYQYVTTHFINYRSAMSKTDRPLLIRPIGSFMFLQDDHNVLETVYSKDFPSEVINPSIVICENSSEAESDWVQYLNKRFPNERVRVINFFGSRDAKNISDLFEDVKYVTFSTTFSNYDWFCNLVDNVTSGQKIIGYSHNDEKWDKALSLAEGKNIEVIKSLFKG